MKNNESTVNEKRDNTPEAAENSTPKTREELQKMVDERVAEIKARAAEANEAMREGKGRLKLEKPIIINDKETDTLEYDFTIMTGMDYTDAMDSDHNARDTSRTTHRQFLALFAKAAAKCTPGADMEDIVERIGATDAITGEGLASLFFMASTRAGRLRISKKSSSAG